MRWKKRDVRRRVHHVLHRWSTKQGLREQRIMSGVLHTPSVASARVAPEGERPEHEMPFPVRRRPVSSEQIGDPRTRS